MANILDIRRRIRSVINTRQITKAMKDGLGGEVAPRAGARPGGASVRADADECAEVAGVAGRDLRSGDRRTEASSAGAAGRKKYPADRGHRRQRPGGRVQREHHEGRDALPGVQGRQEHRHRSHRPQGARLPAPSLSGRQGADAEPDRSSRFDRGRTGSGRARWSDRRSPANTSAFSAKWNSRRLGAGRERDRALQATKRSTRSISSSTNSNR